MGVLSDFGLNVQRTIPRRGSVLVRRNFAHAAPIDGVDTATDEIDVSSNNFKLWDYATHVYHVEGDTVYTVQDVVDFGVTQTIAVAEDIQSALTGTLIPTTFRNLGQVGDVSVEWSVNKTEASTTGRSRELSLDLVIAATLRQTSDSELAGLEALTGFLLDVIVTPELVAGDLAGNAVGQHPAALHTKNSFYVQGVLANVAGAINFMSEGSGITLNIPMRITTAAIGDKPIVLA